MKLTENSLRQPAAVAAAVALLALFGLMALSSLPLQLFPDIDRPQLSVSTGWRGAAPQEVEAELIAPIENVLRGLPGLETMESTINGNWNSINLGFAVGSDMQAMLVEVLARLNRLPPLPRDATPPVVQSGSDQANSTLTYFFVQKLPHAPGRIDDYRRLVEERVVPQLTAVPGVAGVDINGGSPEELVIRIDLDRAASLGIGISDISSIAARAMDVSGGSVQAGRREYSLRFAGRYPVEGLGELILAWRDGRPVYLADVASISVEHPEPRFFTFQNGNPALGLRIQRENGANVLATIEAVKRAVAELRERELLPLGLDMAQSFDAALFIHRAIGLLSGSLFAGVLLAVGCLWWFLRDARATLLIACAIPISLLATFVVLQLSGRSLNVISLAGLAFAVGMVMDAAVVVAENIVRLRERGVAASQAALEGTRQVSGALFASTLTTVAVFLPVLFMRSVEGQLFADLALTISIAVGVSLLLAVTVLPTAAGRWLRSGTTSGTNAYAPLVQLSMRWTATRQAQLGWVVALVLAPLLLTAMLLPRIDYLPPVKRAAIDSNFRFPPGMSPAMVDRELRPLLEQRIAPYLSGEKQPQLSNWYLSLWSGGGTLGARVIDQSRIGELEQIIREEIVSGLPDTQVHVREGELFGGFGGESSRAIALHLQHEDEIALAAAAEHGRHLLTQYFPGANVRAFPDPAAATPELRIEANDRRLAEAGWRRSDLGDAVRVLGEGLWLGERFDGDRRMPILLRSEVALTPDTIGQAPLVTPQGGALALSELASLETVLSPGQLRRVSGRRSITLSVDPPAAMSLEEALQIVQDQIVPALRQTLPVDAAIRVSGSADRLAEVVRTMGSNFLLALLVLLLLMAAMFRSLGDACMVLASLPLALLGGVLGLLALDLAVGQSLDLLTMIGFILLLGMVVNNAILLVARTRQAQAEGLTIDAALDQALSQRLRPILIAALTGVLGALPMAINPGPGAVIYRGMAAVAVGGMGLSLVFTILLVPALLRLSATGRSELASRPPRAATVHHAHTAI